MYVRDAANFWPPDLCSNSVHGAAYYVFQNTYLKNANTYETANAGKPRNNDQVSQTGLVIDGSVYIPKIYNGRDKSFFMFSFKGVYAKPPFGGTEQVLNNLASYTYRVAISGHGLVAFENDRVSFRWRDYTHGGKRKVMTVSADEFLRRKCAPP